MGFSLVDELPKLLWLVIGVAGFLAVIGALLLLVDAGPRKTRTEWWQATLFLAPALILLILGLVYPVIRTTLLSFMDSKMDSKGAAWVGLDNYIAMFTQPEILVVLRNTF